MSETYAVLVAEQRRYPQLSYKSDIIFVSGLDVGDQKAIEKQYRGSEPPCQLDPEDGRFVLKGPKFNPMSVINILAKDRGYKVLYAPQQHSIPLKQGSSDDKFAMIFYLSKPNLECDSTAAAATVPSPPQRVDSLGGNPPDIVHVE